GVADDLAAGAHFLQRLRVYHPLLAILVGGFVVYVAQQLRAQQPSGPAHEAASVTRWAARLTWLYLAQVALGSLNFLLLAPAAVQVAHLLMADLTWIACVQLCLAVAARRAPELQVSFESAAS
ncbi:MAG TPA: COX15/CtaA family protein, partial [Polyangiales bacterium]